MNRPTVEDQQAASQVDRGARRSERGREREGAEAGSERGSGIEMARLREVGRNLGAQLEEQARKRPYVVIGAAAGIGFVAGSLFGSRLGQVLLACGLGYVAKNVVVGDLGIDRIEAGIEKLTGEAPGR
jgi:hypothetical protein